jgi:hypothetical protein
MDAKTDSGRQKWLDSLFFSHLNELAVQSQLFLGRIPHPSTGQTMYDSDLARQTIDTLTAIVQRCESTFGKEEKAQIDQMLDQLRMLYVETVGQPMPDQTDTRPQQEPQAESPKREESTTPENQEASKSPDIEEGEDRKVRFQKRYG